MKKIISVLLICSVLLSCVPVFADEPTDKEKLQTKLLEEQGLIFLGDVPNDVTGNWRLSEYTSEESPEAFALDYYRAYFEDDNEIHAIINRTIGITIRVTYGYGLLFVTVFNYHQDEEKDAKVLFDGHPIADYGVDCDTGEVEKYE